MIHKYTGNLRLDKKLALKNQRALRLALKIFEADPELSGNAQFYNRSRLRSALQTARAIRRGEVHYDH